MRLLPWFLCFGVVACAAPAAKPTDPSATSGDDDDATGDDDDGPSGDDDDDVATTTGDDDDDTTTAGDDDDDTTTVDVDTDGDGLSDATEAALGTDPALADSDGDGFADGDEVADHSDPVDAGDKPYLGGWAKGACRDSIVGQGSGVGQVAENFVLRDQNGENLHLHDFCDREVLLVSAAFW
jgi:hypothetical protein